MEISSALALRNEWLNEDEDTYRIDGGYNKIIQYLLASCKENDVDLHLSSAVKKIEWNKGGAKVYTKDGFRFTASKVLLTVPVTILSKKNKEDGGIEFIPALPNYTAAAQQTGFGTAIKIFLQFSDSFWAKQVKHAGFIISNQVIPTWWTQWPAESKMLTGWLGGPAAKALRNAEEKIILKLALESLANIFSTDADLLQTIVKSYHIADWSQADFINGAYSYATPATAEARQILQTPMEETIYFAGEAIYQTETPGTVEAALFSAVKVVEVMSGCHTTEVSK